MINIETKETQVAVALQGTPVDLTLDALLTVHSMYGALKKVDDGISAGIFAAFIKARPDVLFGSEKKDGRSKATEIAEEVLKFVEDIDIKIKGKNEDGKHEN